MPPVRTRDGHLGRPLRGRPVVLTPQSNTPHDAVGEERGTTDVEFDIVWLLVAFAGGAFGAAIGGQTAFIFTGFAFLFGFSALLGGVPVAQDFISVFAFGPARTQRSGATSPKGSTGVTSSRRWPASPGPTSSSSVASSA